MPDLLISIVIPTYNYATLLPRALDSVISQLNDDTELIVVDDGSIDNTPEVLAAYLAQHPGVQNLRQANAGAAAARNRGIQAASGRYVLLLDADDELLPGALDELRRVVGLHPEAGMVLGAHISAYTNGRERLRLPTEVPPANARQLIRRYLLQKQISISHCCSLFRRDLLLQRPYPEGLRSGEDIAVFAYLLISAPVVTTTKALAKIHKHADSLRHNPNNAEAMAQLMVREVFASLPTECQPLRQRYEAQRYLSLFRAAQSEGRHQEARCYYRHALALSPLQAVRWTYLRKALRLGIQARS